MIRRFNLQFESNIITIQSPQETVSTVMSKSSRGEKSNCPISYSLDLFGDRWTLLVLRDLILWGKTRFAELQSSDEKIASNILSDRLRRLEARGIIGIEKDPSDARQKIYTATEKGLSLTPVLLEIAAWGRLMTRKRVRRMVLRPIFTLIAKPTMQSIAAESRAFSKSRAKPSVVAGRSDRVNCHDAKNTISSFDGGNAIRHSRGFSCRDFD